MKNYSIWKEDINKTKYPSINKNINVDVLIIGGGITGISCGYYLTKNNLKEHIITTINQKAHYVYEQTVTIENKNYNKINSYVYYNGSSMIERGLA